MARRILAGLVNVAAISAVAWSVGILAANPRPVLAQSICYVQPILCDRWTGYSCDGWCNKDLDPTLEICCTP